MKTKALALLVLAVLLTLPLAGCNRRAVGNVPLSEQMAQEAESNTEAQAGATSPIVTPEPTTEAPPLTVEATAVMTVETTPEPTAEPTEEPTVEPTAEPTATAVATTTAETGPNGEPIHIVQAGENLFRIALRYGTTVEAIAQANGITNPALIWVGQKLVIPTSTSAEGSASGGSTAGETIYTVQPGDNLFRIALKYNMSYLYLAQYNGIVNPNFLIVGQQIRIPAQP